MNIPDRVGRLLKLGGPESKGRILEMLAAEGYRSGSLSREDVSGLLGLQPKDTLRFLKERGCARLIAIEEYEDVADALDDFTEAILKGSRVQKRPR